MTLAVVLLGTAVVVLGAGLGVTTGLWLGGRRQQRLLRARVASLQQTGWTGQPGQGSPARARRRMPGLVPDVVPQLVTGVTGLVPTRVPTGREVVKGVMQTANLVAERGIGGALRSSIDELAVWARVERPDLVRMAGPDGSVAILFSDIVGSTSLNEELGDQAWVKLLERHDRAVRRRVDAHDGHVVKTQGDGFLVAFSRPEQAVRSAIEVQRAFDRGSRKGRTPVAVRIGVHCGDVVHRDGDIFGRNVAQAARVAALADGGEILVSEPVATAVERLDDVVLGETREVELRGLRGEHQLTLVDWSP